jgi:hypothetical protein
MLVKQLPNMAYLGLLIMFNPADGAPSFPSHFTQGRRWSLGSADEGDDERRRFKEIATTKKMEKCFQDRIENMFFPCLPEFQLFQLSLL